jgi:hypothetical protein
VVVMQCWCVLAFNDQGGKAVQLAGEYCISLLSTASSHMSGFPMSITRMVGPAMQHICVIGPFVEMRSGVGPWES